MSFLPGWFPGHTAPAGGAFPVVAATNTTNATNSANLPSGINAGDLLLLFLGECMGGTPAVSGWNSMFSIGTSGNPGFLVGYYKVASGSEGSSISLSAGSACSTAYRITGYQGTPESATASSTANAAPNPPTLSPSWWAAKTLWIAVGVVQGSTSGSNWPVLTALSNYTGLITATNFNPFNDVCSIGSAQRELEAASEDPGTFTATLSPQGWLAATVAIQGA